MVIVITRYEWPPSLLFLGIFDDVACIVVV